MIQKIPGSVFWWSPQYLCLPSNKLYIQFSLRHNFLLKEHYYRRLYEINCVNISLFGFIFLKAFPYPGITGISKKLATILGFNQFFNKEKLTRKKISFAFKFYYQYYVMNYSINSFTGASEANLLPGVEAINKTLEGGDYH